MAKIVLLTPARTTKTVVLTPADIPKTVVVKSGETAIPLRITRGYEMVIIDRCVYFRKLFSDEK